MRHDPRQHVRRSGRRLIPLLILLLLAAVLCHAVPARSYSIASSGWARGVAGMYVNSSGGGDTGLQSVLDAMRTWNNVGTSYFQFVYAGASTSSTYGRNSHSNIVFQDPGGGYVGYANWWSLGGVILESDVKLKPGYSQDYTTAVGIHELGHALGVNHSGSSSSVMQPTVYGQLSLGTDDIAAITAKHPYPFSAFQASTGDFDGDGKDDVLWKRSDTGKVAVWCMDGTTATDGLTTGTIKDSLSTNWRIKGVGDFDGDGKDDALWRNHATGTLAVWLLDGTTHTDNLTTGVIKSGLSMDWRIKGLGDFNGDGKKDVLFRNMSTGSVAVWLLDGATESASLTTGTIKDGLSLYWRYMAIGDFDGDGKDDVMFRNESSGKVAVWLLDGATSTDSLTTGNVHDGLSLYWQLKGVGDFNADGKDDIAWQNVSSGKVAVWCMDGVTATSSLDTGVVNDGIAVEWAFIGAGDFDADGKDDLIWTRTDNRKTAVWLLDGASGTDTIDTGVVKDAMSTAWTPRTIGDFNGDGKADVLWMRTDTGKVAVWCMDGTKTTDQLTTGVVKDAMSTSWAVQGN